MQMPCAFKLLMGTATWRILCQLSIPEDAACCAISQFLRVSFLRLSEGRN